MRKYLQLIRKKGYLGDNIRGLIFGTFRGGKKFYKSHRVRLVKRGRLDIRGKLYFGFLSNKLTMPKRSRGVLEIGENGKVQINGIVKIATSCKVYVNGDLTIGNATYINPNTTILANTNVSIGANCAISWNCQILDDDLHQVEIDGVPLEKAKPIIIEDHVWIGANCIILKGVTIGKNSVIAAGSIVTKDVAPNCLVAGSPAKVIREKANWK